MRKMSTAKLNVTLNNVNINYCIELEATSTLSSSDLCTWPIFEESQRPVQGLRLGTPKQEKDLRRTCKFHSVKPQTLDLLAARQRAQTAEPPRRPAVKEDDKRKEKKITRSWWGSAVDFAGNFLSSPMISSTHQSWRRPTGRASVRLSYSI